MILWLRAKGYDTFWPHAKGYTTFHTGAKGYATFWFKAFQSKAKVQGGLKSFPLLNWIQK